MSGAREIQEGREQKVVLGETAKMHSWNTSNYKALLGSAYELFRKKPGKEMPKIYGILSTGADLEITDRKKSSPSNNLIPVLLRKPSALVWKDIKNPQFSSLYAF